VKRVIPTAFILLLTKFLPAQICTNPGQTPPSAILLCSNEPVSQSSVPICGQLNIPVPCNDGAAHQNVNPIWYKIGCFGSGTLGFVITPSNLNDNYDWQLFDITTHNPDDVFSVSGLFVACNWCPDPGETGASIDGINTTVCSIPGQLLFSDMPVIIAGHEYLLMISNHNGTPDGFQLVITGGSAVISDPMEPQLLSARQSCDGSKLILKLNRGMRCSSLAPDGSDFIISGGYIFTSASSTGCGSSPVTDSIILTLNSPLTNGNYILTAQNGSDGNTLTDICNRSIFPGQQLLFTVASLQPTPMDSVQLKNCSPSSLKLVFKKPIQCNSIETGGSDFKITGPQPVVITGIKTNCNTGIPPASTVFEITLDLSASILTGGVYQLQLVRGADGNTLIDECGLSTPPTTLNFTLKNAVSADFNYSVRSSCKTDTLSFFHDGNNGAINWNWSFDNNSTSNLQNPVKIFPDSGLHKIRLVVSNGSCTDSLTKNITLQNKITAAFIAPAGVCPGDPVQLINKSTGNINNWQWNLGNGVTSNLSTPPAYQYAINGITTDYTVKLVAINSQFNCSDSATHIIKALKNCYAAIPTAFTPNGDGLNDYLYPLNASKADHMEFKIYNRMGQLVFISNNLSKKWDGKFLGLPQDTGLFIWMLSYTHHDTGEKIFLKGTTLLIR
jgi:gliding motility-associated-like protein